MGVGWEARGEGWMGGEGWGLDERRGVGVGWEARGGGWMGSEGWGAKGGVKKKL